MKTKLPDGKDWTVLDWRILNTGIKVIKARILAHHARMKPVVCPRCKNEIDPEVCHCGDWIKNHHGEHAPVPMGCRCRENIIKGQTDIALGLY